MNGQPLLKLDWIAGHFGLIVERLGQHLELTVLPVALGFLVSLALAIAVLHRPRAYAAVVAVSGILYTVPSLAAYVIMASILGLTLLVAIVPLTTYTLLILVRAIVSGFEAVPADVLEAADGMGYTRRERLLRVELPLAVPLMIAGLRIATVSTIGLATVAAVLGDTYGGFGQFLTEGIQNLFPTEIYLGAALSVLLAVAADLILVVLQRQATPWLRARAGAS